jgi:hydroxymethylbilane synthase
MTKRHLVIATRESPLALKQAEWVKNQLLQSHPHLAIEFLGITTQADKLVVNLQRIGGKGLFVKELEEALLDQRADIAVHSMKDVPMELPDGLTIPVICQREDVRDAFVSNLYPSIATLKSGASIGTSSLRRQIQLHALRSDLTIHNLRGNINTRLSRLDKGDFDGLILACAGLKRMNFSDRIRQYLSIEQSLPAAGQGALGIECRETDHATLALIAPLNHNDSFAAVTAERAVCRRLNGGCQVPIAAYAEVHQDVLTLKGLVGSPTSLRILQAKNEGHMTKADSIGDRVAEELIQQGALKILQEFNNE